MSGLAAWAALALVVAAGFAAELLSGPGGLLVYLVPRRRRVWWRHLRARGAQRSARIPTRLRRMVGRADRGRCVYCGSRWRLQVDHIVPWSLGGVTCLWNLALLCGQHNRVKSNLWVSRAGRVYYRPFTGSADQVQAIAIAAAERRARRSPARWVRALAAMVG